jgi:hypothetical protein
MLVRVRSRRQRNSLAIGRIEIQQCAALKREQQMAVGTERGIMWLVPAAPAAVPEWLGW